MLWAKSFKHCKEWKLPRHSEVIQYLLKTCATDNIIAEMDDEALRSKRLTIMESPENTKELCNNALCTEPLYDGCVLTGITIEGLHESIRHNMQVFWIPSKSATVQDQVRHVTSLTNLQHGLQSTKNLCTTLKSRCR